MRSRKKNKRRKGLKKKITRKEAIKKTGKLAALTAASMLILSPKDSQAQSQSFNTPRAPRAWGDEDSQEFPQQRNLPRVPREWGDN